MRPGAFGRPLRLLETGRASCSRLSTACGASGDATREPVRTADTGASDASGAFPAADAQTPENFAATIYDALAIPRTAEWHDTTGRPYAVYMAEPIPGLRA